MDEAVYVIVMRMKDEASDKIQNTGKVTERTGNQFREFKLTLLAVGSAMTSMGSLLGKIDSPLTKTLSNFLLTAGAIMSTVSAIGYAIPAITKMVAAIQQLNIVSAIQKALSGPAGWIALGAGAAVAGAAVYGISQAGQQPARTPVTVNVPMYLDRQVVGRSSQTFLLENQDRNGTSGVK
jgi:hypothetical protein